MGITKRSLIFLILVLGLCVGAAVLVPIFRANKSSIPPHQSFWCEGKLANQPPEAEGVQKEEPKNLRPAIEYDEADARWRAVKPLDEFEDNSSIEPIAIKDKRVRFREIEALKKTGDIYQVVELLISALKDENMEVQEREIDYVHAEDLLLIEKALIKIGKPAVEPLIAVLKDKHNNYARFKAIKILGKIGGGQAVEPLIIALQDNNWDIRWRAAKALGELGDSSAIKPLTIALKDKDRRVRYRAVEALGKIGDKRAVEPLNARLKDEDLYVRLKVIETLKMIAREDSHEWQRQEWLEQNQWLMQRLLERQFKQQEQKLLKEQTKLLREQQLLEQNKDRFSAQELLEQQKLLERSSQKLLEQEQWLKENKEKFTSQK